MASTVPVHARLRPRGVLSHAGLRPRSALFAMVAGVTLFRVAAQTCNSRCPPVDSTGQEVPSLCPGSSSQSVLSQLGALEVCHPQGTPEVQLRDLVATSSPPEGPARLVVVANYFTGCNAGRREANVYSYTSTVLHERYPNILFLTSLKGGSPSSCRSWANTYEQDGAAKLGASDAAVKQPFNIHDGDYILRDALFTPPYGHPSYVIIDHRGVVREKFVGPCCGSASYYDCTDSTALGLNQTLHTKIAQLLAEVAGEYSGQADCFLTDWTEWAECACPESTPDNGRQQRTRSKIQNAIGNGFCPALQDSQDCFCSDPVQCEVGEWSDWSLCSRRCGTGRHHRTREVMVQPAFGGAACPDLLDSEVCQQPPCEEQCVPELGEAIALVPIATAAQGLRSPRDVAFSPVPGRHLGEFSSGQSFSTSGEEAWIANGHGHSLTIVTGIGEDGQQSLTRFDRGWFHYMMNITALSFNAVGSSNRDPLRDTFGFFATCQDNNNTYNGRKEPNFFMGPTLYSSSPEYKNLVRGDGGPCSPADECFFLHSDMLHESPACPGIVHDPETATAYGTVYWAIDGVTEQLVRYDFQQPHGPGKMDHSIAAVRRYPEVGITKGPPGIHQGMVIDAAARILYVSSTARGEVLRVHIDTGAYARTAREEHPIFSSQFPSFEYSIFECVQWDVFAESLHQPSGLAISEGRLFVAEHMTGAVAVYDLASGFRMRSYDTGRPGLMGLSFAPRSGLLYGVNALENTLFLLQPSSACSGSPAPYVEPDYRLPSEEVDWPEPSAECVPNATIPNSSLFVQVHNTGYASDDPSVQNDTMMDDTAALLASRTDCEPNSTLNFDALLLGGYYCHPCLPDICHNDGRCTNLQWRGYMCDNEVRVTQNSDGQIDIDPPEPAFEFGRTYLFVINAPEAAVRLEANGQPVSAEMAVGTLVVDMKAPLPDALAVAAPHRQILSLNITGVPRSNVSMNSSGGFCVRIPKAMARKYNVAPCPS